MKSVTKYFPVLFLAVLFVPNISFAASSAQAQQLSLELSQLQASLGVEASSTTVSLSPGQSIQQATSSGSKGVLTIKVLGFLHTNPDPAIPTNVQQPIYHFAKITLEYDPCVAAAPSICVTQASSSYPVMTSTLMQSDNTRYLNYLITLTSLSSTTATFTIADSSFLTSIQNQINAIGVQVRQLLGS